MSNFFSGLRGKKVAFIGAGVAHRELIELFAKAGAAVTLCDRKKEGELAGAERLRELGVVLSLGAGYLGGLAGQEMVLRTPGFSFNHPALRAAAGAGAYITSEVELFFKHCPCKLVGITGSDGKTTTSSLIAAMYRAAGHNVHLGGNIGRPLLPIVDSIACDDVAVVELSSFQLISMRRSPHIAVVTNVTPNHLDHHRDMAEYVDAKRNILAWQNKENLAVLGYENHITRGMQKDAEGRLSWFSRLRKVTDGAFLSADNMLCIARGGAGQAVLPAGEVKLRGLHNIENLLAAMAAACGDVSCDAMRTVASTFAGVEHRIEPVRTLNGVDWYNDSIASSPTRVIAGLHSFGKKLILIAGGYDKKIPFDPLAPEILTHVKHLILMGQTANAIEAVVRAHPNFEGSGLTVSRAADMESAVGCALKASRPGDTVILSPACASFDAYPNFEARGRHFKELVNTL